MSRCWLGCRCYYSTSSGSRVLRENVGLLWSDVDGCRVMLMQLLQRDGGGDHGLRLQLGLHRWVCGDLSRGQGWWETRYNVLSSDRQLLQQGLGGDSWLSSDSDSRLLFLDKRRCSRHHHRRWWWWWGRITRLRHGSASVDTDPNLSTFSIDDNV